MIGQLSQVFQFFAFELFVKFFSKIPQNSHQKVAISRYTMKPSLNVSRNFVLYAQIRAACKKWYKSYGSKKSSVPEKFSLVYSAVSLVNRSSRQDPTRGRKKSGDISPPPSCYRGSDLAGANLPYVVEGHASACPQTVGVGTLCGVVLLTLRGRTRLVWLITVTNVKVRVF